MIFFLKLAQNYRLADRGLLSGRGVEKSS